MKRHGNPEVVVTDKCPSYHAAMKVIGSEGRQETGRHSNNRAEDSHQPFRRRERVMSRFRRMRSLQKFASMHSSVHNHFNHQRSIERRAGFKSLRDAALREWRELLVVQDLLTREKRRRVRIRLTAPGKETLCQSGSHPLREDDLRQMPRNSLGSGGNII
ncbi:ISHne6, transposase [Hyphomonas hirschiana VP5]|uniref:ISHne6, transposase n=1 Tax=Hyphomonas hirschiana VP5 TaxID=1280951 RepID=A0A059FQZ6_9PROT|nr:ISHne6, transposase [Hyphomonas hirschiana VP5]